MYPASDWSILLRATMDISAHAFSLADRPQRGRSGHQCSHAPGRPILHLYLSLSQTSAGKLSYVIDSYVIDSSSSFALSCSFVRAWRPFLRPDLRATDAPRAGAVKAGRGTGLASFFHAARPRLDRPKHGARITLDG